MEDNGLYKTLEVIILRGTAQVFCSDELQENLYFNKAQALNIQLADYSCQNHIMEGRENYQGLEHKEKLKYLGLFNLGKR